MKRVAWSGTLLVLLVGCGEDAALDRTLATVEIVRGESEIADVAIAQTGRSAPGQRVSVGERGLARLSLDSGPQLLMDADSQLDVVDEATVRLAAGRVYAETAEGEELFLESSQASLRASDAAVSARVVEGGLEVYVVRGEVSWRRSEPGAAADAGERGIARAGERLTLAGDAAESEPVTLWDDWTGGLAQPGPADARGAAGVGVLEARVPDEVGLARWPLVVRRLDVQVRIEGDLAITEVEQVFFNPASEMVEGFYRVRVPDAAVLQRFAVDRNGRLVDGYVREKAQARQAYEAQVYRGSTLDPALLEWVAPGRYQARIYPIRPGEARRIVIRYAEWLRPLGEGGPRLYNYPMGAGRRAPRIQELSITVDFDASGATSVRAGMGATIEEGRVRLRRSDFAPRSDFWLELVGGDASTRAFRARHQPPPRAPDAVSVPGEADERDYWYLPLRLPDALFADVRREGVDLVIVADVSAGTDRAHLELGRSVAEALTAHLGENDRVAVVTSDLTIRSLGAEAAALGPPSAARLEGLLDALARAPAGGATDIGAAIGAAAALLDPSRPGAVIYVGDGAPTVGELEADGLLERLARLPAPLRLYAVGIGGDANLELLEALTRGGGLALRVEERSAAADASLRILAHALRPVAQRVTVDVGTGIENVYPRRPVDVVFGEVLPVVGRVREGAPTEVTVRGTIGGEPFEQVIAITTHDTEESTDLRLRWAGERLRQLLLDGAGREEVAELGTRYGLITPFTSYYVPSAQEIGQLGARALPWLDRPSLLAEAAPERSSFAAGLLGLALGPLSLSGCTFSGSEPDLAEEEAPAWMQETSETVAEPASTTAATPSANRYGIQGPDDDEGGSRRGQDQGAMAEEAPSMPSPVTTGAAIHPMEDEMADTLADMAPPPAQAPPPEPSAGAEAIDGWGGGGGTVSRRMAAGARPAPSSGSRILFQRGPGGSDGSAMPASSPPRPEEDRANERSRGAALGFFGAIADEPSPDELRRDSADGDLRDAERSARDASVVVVRWPEAADATHHARRRCSDAAALRLADREELWRERVGQQSSASGWLTVYRQAQRDCELDQWRDRRAMMNVILRAAGSVDRMLEVYRHFDSGSARGFLRAAILRRVRSPQDLRAVRGAFGLGQEPDWELVEQVVERANGAEAKIRALRRLSMQYPNSFDLSLRLMEALERADHAPEARRLADRLRVDPRSDAGVRTAVGEMLLRMGMEEDARRVFSEIVEFAPLDELARRRLGDLYRAHGWFEDAYRQYQTLAAIRPDDPSALLLLAQAAAGTGRIDEALRLEQRLMETAQPGAERGIARVAQLWTSVRLAKLRQSARTDGDDERLTALARRMRRSGVLQGAGDLRVTLSWSHPDAQLSLWTAHPDATLARPEEIAPEHGIEAFDIPEQEDGAYRFEVRRADAEAPTDLDAELVVVWHEGRDDEVVHVIPLEFTGGRANYAWSLRASELTGG